MIAKEHGCRRGRGSNHRQVLRAPFLAGVLFLVPTLCAAQSTPQTGGDAWKHTIAVYVLGAGLSGEVVTGNVGADVDVSFSEILDNLKIGGMVAYRGDAGKWALVVNAFYVGVGTSKELALGGTADVDVDQSFLEAEGAYQASERCELYYGLRGFRVRTAVELRPTIGSDVSDEATKSWIDPLLGLRVVAPIGRTWSFVGRGDVAGFGIGSDWTWQVIAHFDWQATKTFGLAFGYQALSTDYDSGSGSDRFRYDVVMEGPFAAGTFTF